MHLLVENSIAGVLNLIFDVPHGAIRLSCILLCRVTS